MPPYAELSARAISVAPFGLVIKVASLEDLVAMKRAGGRPIDLVDLELLERNLGSDRRRATAA